MIIIEALQYKASIAYAKSKNSAVRVLIQAGYNPLASLYRIGDPLTIAFRNNYTLVVKELLSYDNIYISDRYNELLIDAIFYNAYSDIILILDNSRIDPTAQNNVTIATASEKKKLKTVEFLLYDSIHRAGNRANPESLNNTAITEASADKKLYIIELLLENNRVNSGAQNNAAVISANEHYDVVELLLKDKKTYPSDQNNTALIKA